jgi:DNA mismatch endonuclease (patch repair protein)
MKRASVRTSPERSALMKRVRQRGTPAELVVRELLRSVGAHYRVNVRGLPGSPDIANKRRRKAIFVHGCFWHYHVECGRGRVPQTNNEFWLEKLCANVARDHRKVEALKAEGFDVLVVWECQTVNPHALREELQAFWFE